MIDQANKKRHATEMTVDVFMIVLLLINLLLISFDWLFNIPYINVWLKQNASAFFEYYKTNISDNFLLIDLGFVAVFLTEFTVRWIISLARKDYNRWFYYPLIHWYDIVGCIPLSAFRVVRFLRIFSIMYRLYRLEIIRPEQSFLFRIGKKYYDILLEELTDRVIIKILIEMQEEVKNAGPTLDNIIKDVLRPKQDTLIDWLSERLSVSMNNSFKRSEADIRDYVTKSIASAFRKNDEIKIIEQIPIAGKAISVTLERSIADIGYNIIERVMNDLSSKKNRTLIYEITEVAFQSLEKKEKDEVLHALVLNTLVDVLESVKSQVSNTKRWKIRETRDKI